MNDLPALDFTPSPAPTRPKASFQIDTREHGKGDRRQQLERRQTIRFEADRRSGQDRRPVSNGWELGIDL